MSATIVHTFDTSGWTRVPNADGRVIENVGTNNIYFVESETGVPDNDNAEGHILRPGQNISWSSENNSDLYVSSSSSPMKVAVT